MNQMHTNGKKRFLAWLMMCAMLFNYFSGVTLMAQESQDSGNTVVIEGGSVVIGGSEPTEPLPGTATVIDRVESLLESEPEETEEATEPEVTEEATQPEETGEATQPETTEEVTQPEETAEATQPETTEAATEPEETQDVTEPKETLEATEPEETEAVVQPTGSQWFLFDMATQTITGYSEDPMAPLDVIIPAQLYGVDVVAIGEMAFAGLSVTRVTVEAGSRLERVESKAFWNCTSLAVLELPEGIQVADDALEGCTLLGYGPTTADARAEDCVVYIGGVAMDASTDGTEVSYYVNGGTVTYTDPGSWNAKLWYDADNSRMTLSLNGLEATGVGVDECFSAYGAGVFAEYKGAFCIDLTGMNTATGVPDSNYGNCQGVYTKGNYHTLTITGTGTLKAIGQDPTGYNFGLRTTDLTVESGTVIGIASDTSGTASIGVQGSSITINGGRVEGTGGNATSYSKGIYSSSGDFTVTNATVVGVCGDAKETYGLNSYKNFSFTNANVTGRCDGTAQTLSSGLYSRYKTVSTDSTVTATAGTATQGDSKGLWAGAYSTTSTSASYSLTITGGTVTATGGTSDGGASVGIQSTSYVKITGGTVNATAGTSNGGNSAGIYTIKSSITITDDAKVTAQGGETDQRSYGMYSPTTLEIEDASVVTATAGKAGIASYGAFVTGNFTLQDTASLTVEGGEVTGEPAEGDSWKYRSVGLWMGAASETESGPTYKDDLCVISGGRLVAKSADTASGFSGAVGFYDVMNIIYTDSQQTDSAWYQWRINEADQPTLSATTAYTHKGDWLQDATDEDYISPHYLCIEPAVIVQTKQVTFKIDGGTWDGSDSDDKVYNLTPDENGDVDFSTYIPTGMTATTSGQTGFWDITPPDTASGLDAVTYTYRFADGIVWVGGKPMWASKSGTATYFVNTTKEVTDSAPATYHAKLWYDGSNLTLSLDGLDTSGIGDDPASLGAGIYTIFGLYLDVSGTNTLQGAVCDSKVYGIYAGTLNFSGSGTLTVTAGDPAVTTTEYTYGIYSTGSISVSDTTLNVTAELSTEQTAGVYSQNDITINSGSTNVTYSGSYKPNSYSVTANAFGILATNYCTIHGGTVTVTGSSTEDTSNTNMAIAAVYKDLKIDGGTVTAIAGKSMKSNSSTAGTYAIIGGASKYLSSSSSNMSGSVYISGDAVVKATGGDVDNSGISMGIFGYDGVYLSGNCKVTAETGTDVVRAQGISSAWDMTVSDNAYVTATAHNAVQYSIGTFVWGNFTMSGNTVYITTSGNSTQESNYYDRDGDGIAECMDWLDGLHKCRSIGLWMGVTMSSSYDKYDGSGGDSRNTFTITGGTLIASSGTAWGHHFDGALGFYSNGSINFGSDPTWYKWRISSDNAYTLSSETAYTHMGDWYNEQTDTTGKYVSPHYLEIVADSVPEKKVTFKVVDGTWSDGTTDDIIVNVPLVDADGNTDINGSGDLSASIPTGMTPNTAGQTGFWDVTPPDTVTGTDPVTYTYRFADGIVWVGGKPMWANKGGTVTYFVNSTREVTETAPEAYHAKCWFNGNDLTLTVDGLDTTGVEDDATTKAAAIYTAYKDLTIDVHGTNTVEGSITKTPTNYGTADGKIYRTTTYAVYVNGVTFTGDGTFTNKAINTTDKNYAVYSAGTFTMESGTLNVNTGEAWIGISGRPGCSVAIYAAKDVVIDDGKIIATTSGADQESSAIWTEGKLTINGGVVDAHCNYVKTTPTSDVPYGYGYIQVLHSYSDMTINAGTVNAIGTTDRQVMDNGGSPVGLAVEHGDFIVNGGDITVVMPDSKTNYIGMCAGICAPVDMNYDVGAVFINGGTVKVTLGDGTATLDGIWGMNGVYITGGEVEVTTGASIYTYGIKSDYPFEISGDAKVTTTAGDAYYGSCGLFVWGDFKMSGNPTLIAKAGKSTVSDDAYNDPIMCTPYDCHSYGIWMSSGRYEDESTVSETNTFLITGGTLIASCDTARYCSLAIAFKDVIDGKMTYSDSAQPNDQWYQWKTSPSDSFTLSKNTAYVHDGDILAKTGPTYVHIEPTSDDRQEDGIVWVGGMRMDASRDGTEVCYFQNTGKVVTQALASDTPPADWNAKLWFDTSDSSNVRLVLTLDELDTTGIQNDTDSYGAGIYTAYADTLYIDLIGENKVVGDTAEVVLRDSYGIFVGELALDDSMIVESYYPLVIQSSVDGSLSASSTATFDYVVGIAAGDLRIENCTVSAASDMSYNSSTVSYGSFGIYVYAKDTNGNLIIDNATVTAESGDSFGVLGAIGIHVGFGDLEIKNGSDVTAKAGVGRHYNQNVYSWFIYENCPSYGVFTRGAGYDVTVTDSTLEASSGETGGQSVGIATFKGNMSFTDSRITATGGKGQQSSAGILANVVSPIYFGIGGNGKVTCDGTTELTATGEESISGISAGLWAYKNLEIKGSAQVSAKGGTDSDQSIGIFCGSKLNICEEAVVEAVARQASDASYGVCVYGNFHMHNDTGADNSYPKLTATAGNASGGTAWNNHSAGIWMGDSTQSDSGATSKSDSFIISSGTMIAQAGTSGGFVGAVGFYDVQREKITYIDTIQTNTTWYRWKTAVSDPFTWSGVAPYDENLDWLNGTNIPAYLHIEPGEEEPRQQDAIVWVGGKPMDASVDGSEVSYFQNTNKVVIQSYSAAAEPETWNAKLWYDTANSRMTLTLKELDTFGITGDADSLGAGIYTAYADLFYIDLIGENKVEGATYTRSSDGTCSRGIFIKESSELVIGSAQSTGVLDVKAIDAANSSEGIYAGKLTITGGTINVVSGESESSSSTGVYVDTGYLTVKDSTLNATSGSALNMSAAVETGSRTINLSNATVTATLTGTCRRSYGIRSYGNLLAEDSTITVVGSDDSATCEVYGIWARGRTVLEDCTTTVNAGSTTGSDYDSKGISTGDGSTADTRRLEINDGEVTVTAGSSTNGASFGLYSTGSTIIKGGAKVNVQSGANSQETYGLYSCANLTVADTAQVEITAVDAAQTSCAVVTLENFHMSGTPVLLATAGKVTAQPQDSADAWKYRSAGIWLGDKSETSAGAAARNSFTITGGKLISKSADTAPGFSGALGFYDVDAITYSDGSQTDSTWYMWKIDSPANRFTVSSRTAYVHKGDWLLDAAGVDANGDPYISTHYLHIEPKTVKEVTFQVVNGTWSDGTTADITIEIPLVDAAGNPDPNGTGTLEIGDIPTGMLPLPGFDFGKWDPVPDDTTPIPATDPAVYIYSFVTAAPMTAVDTGASGMGLMLLALAMVSALTMFAVGQTRRRLGVSGKS